jgi:hypothetical protein
LANRIATGLIMKDTLYTTRYNVQKFHILLTEYIYVFHTDVASVEVAIISVYSTEIPD